MTRVGGRRRWLLAAAALALLWSACATDRHRDDAVARGRRHVEQQQYAAALVEFRAALKADPLSGEARRELAEAYFLAGQPERGFQEYIRAADLLLTRHDVQIRAGNLLLLGGQFEEARQRAERVVAADPKNAAAHVLLGSALAGLQHVDTAIDQIEEALALDPRNSIAHSALGTVELARGRLVEAEKAFKAAVAADPGSATASLALGNFYWSVGDTAQAETALRKAVTLDHAATLPRRALALLYLVTGRAAEAEPHLRALAAASPDPRATLALAHYYVLRGDPARSRAVVEDLERAKGQTVSTRLHLARLAYRAGEKEQAHWILDQVLAHHPNQLDAVLLHGQWLLVEGHAADALLRARAAVAIDPRSTAAHFLAGAALTARGRNDLAADEFSQVLKLNPRATSARVEIARLYLADGAAATAATFAEEAVRLDPANPAAQLALARTLVMQGDVVRAEQAVSALAGRYPRNAAIQALRGAVAMMKNDVAGARAAFERVAAIDADAPEGLAGLVWADVTAGQTAAARARIEATSDGEATPDLLAVKAAAYIADGRLPRAEATLRSLIEKAPTNMDAYGMLGRLYVASGRGDAAIVDLTRRAEGPVPVGAATMAALLMQSQGHLDEARRQYEAILTVHPRAPIAANNLAWLYAQSPERLEAALHLARTAYEELPNRPETAHTVGWVYLRKDLPSLALAPLERSVTMAPRNALYQFHLGLAYAATRQHGRARTSFERALALDPPVPQAAEIRAALAALPGGTP